MSTLSIKKQDSIPTTQQPQQQSQQQSQKPHQQQLLPTLLLGATSPHQISRIINDTIKPLLQKYAILILSNQNQLSSQITHLNHLLQKLFHSISLELQRYKRFNKALPIIPLTQQLPSNITQIQKNHKDMATLFTSQDFIGRRTHPLNQYHPQVIDLNIYSIHNYNNQEQNNFSHDSNNDNINVNNSTIISTPNHIQSEINNNNTNNNTITYINDDQSIPLPTVASLIKSINHLTEVIEELGINIFALREITNPSNVVQG